MKLSRAGRALLVVLLAAMVGACAPEDEPPSAESAVATAGAESTTAPRPVEATSLLGEPLRRPVLPPQRRDDFLAKLEQARADLEAEPDSPDALVWVGRRTAYLGRYGEAVDIYTTAIERFPDDPRFLRHRGHRHLTTRRLDAAVADLERAWEMVQGEPDRIEPDGLPNQAGIPTSTLHSNIRYHLALAHYLRGELDRARELWRADVEAATNPDMRTASSYWLYLTLRRLGEEERARELLESLPAAEEIIENHDYHRLLAFFRDGGEETPGPAEEGGGVGGLDLSGATVGYGLAAWDLVEGRQREAVERFRSLLDEGQWAAFGVLAAEAELARETGGS